ncbi:type I 3-dehydroquinate dehydratase [uncultured Tyzzerella sp.]|uniref:type I 3-dehydroquinate dehydratase n=1 Tax=uncultured Tyzzerella sp. TaxID=2321398 RepID=UPI00294215A7|nr:type I 3-dehydroquinate dehydratase [uncultured Tyzzerella sp.]
MKNYIKIKNIKIGEGVPKICVPLIGMNKEEFLCNAKKLKDKKLDLVEVRIDYLDKVEDLDCVKDLIKKIRNILKEIPIIFTFRTIKEGGKKEISLQYYKKLNIEVAKSGYVDLIDIELFIGDDIVKQIVDKAHNANVKVIISNHDFSKTPDKEEIVKRLCKMQNLNADLPKIAVMPKSIKDVFTLIYATYIMVDKYPKTPVITISMSKIGAITRIAGETFGSAITFGALDVSSAPGQIDVDKLYNILEILHNVK